MGLRHFPKGEEGSNFAPVMSTYVLKILGEMVQAWP